MNQAFRQAIKGLGLLAAGLALSGCASMGLPAMDDLNPFKEEEERLPGKRIAVLQPQQNVTAADLENAGEPVQLPGEVSLASWSQPGGVPNNAPGHLSLRSALSQAWSVNAGTGSSSSGKLTASPIIYDGRIYTLDAEGRVTAISASNGSRVWRTALVPENEDEEEGYGGGLAADNGRILAATGFGTVVALDPRNGTKLWETVLGMPIRSSPTAYEGKVYATTTEGRLYCLSVEDGSEIWSFRGLPQSGSLLTNASPAIEGQTVIVPYPSGDVVALKVDSGQATWSDSLARSGAFSAFSSMSDPGRPAVKDGVVYAVGHAGRMIASRLDSGERLWTQSVRSTQTPWVAGDTVYVVDVDGKLMALNRQTGKVRWMTRLPKSKTWSGPVLAGRRLWLVSSKGQLTSVDASTGRVLATKDVGDAVYIAPVVAAGAMYILTDDADLIAMR